MKLDALAKTLKSVIKLFRVSALLASLVLHVLGLSPISFLPFCLLLTPFGLGLARPCLSGERGVRAHGTGHGTGNKASEVVRV